MYIQLLSLALCPFSCSFQIIGLLVLSPDRHSCWLEGNERKAQLQIISSPLMPQIYQGGGRILLESWGMVHFTDCSFIQKQQILRGLSAKCSFIVMPSRSNLMGTKFTVFDNALSPERALPDMSNARQELAGIIYVSHEAALHYICKLCLRLHQKRC